MGCCNQRRALASRPPATTGQRAQAVPGGRAPGASDTSAGRGALAGRSGAEPNTQPGVPVRFTGKGRVRVEGTVSGRIYRASPSERLLTVRPEDLRSLVRSGLFEKAPSG